MTLADQPLPLDPVDEQLIENSERFADLAQLRSEVRELRAIVEAARYSHGLEECIEGDCDCEGPPAADGSCPNVETRHATSTDAVIRWRLEHVLGDVLDLFGGNTPPDWTEIRGEIHNGVLWVNEALTDDDPRREKPRPDLYQRVTQAYWDEVRAAASLTAGDTSEGGTDGQQ